MKYRLICEDEEFRVEMEFSDVNLTEVLEKFKDFLYACGFHTKLVDEYMPEVE